MKHLILQLTQVLAVCTALLGLSVHADDTLSQAELEQMLAPVALYPDTVLTHVLIASTYPLEVVQAARWVKANSALSAEQAVRAVEDKTWDPSVKALVAFPQLLERLSNDLDWTQQLGEAFLADESAVLASIQLLREKAYTSGNLQNNEHIVVEREREIIIIEPARKEVVYVPVYDTRVVYGDWWWPSHPPVYWHTSGVYFRSSPFHWGVSVRVRPWFYFSIFDWQHRHVVVHHHYYHKPPRYYPVRHKHYVDARRWHHQPEHRRGVHYRHERLNRDYNAGYGYQQTTRELQAAPVRHNREQRNTDVTVRENKAQYQRKTAEQIRLREPQQRPDSTVPRQHRPVTTEQRMRSTEPAQDERRAQLQQKIRQPDTRQHNDKPVAQRHVSTEQVRPRETVRQQQPVQQPQMNRPVQQPQRDTVQTPVQREQSPQTVRQPQLQQQPQQPRQPATREQRAPQREATVQRQQPARQID